ncbi:MAG: YitT family protein [Oscillospiraceae bacterium]|nr:YitT family protein [Oscillospiraceae bacterium]
MKKSFKFLERIRILNILMLTFAGIINAVGITIFLSPVKLYDSGVSGTAMLLSQITPDWMSLSIFLLLLNTPLFLFGLKREGKLFTFYAIYAVIIYSISAWLITDVLPVDVSFASPLAGTDLLLCALFGGLISGMGSGIALRFGGAMDGIEVLGVIFSKTLGISVGTFCMIYNVILYITCGCVIKSWILPLYSIVTYAAALKTVDFIVDGLDRAKGAMIITSCPWDICEALTQEFGSGMTVINAKGGYSNTDKAMIYFVINRFQVTKMRSIVHEIDKMAYITISDVADVFPANRS